MMVVPSGRDPSPGPLAGRTALVTGAGGDIGRAIAVRLAAAGAGLVLADVGDTVEATAEACARHGIDERLRVVRFDVTDEAQVRRAFETLAADGVVADLLVNNAGYQGEFAAVADADAAEFRRVLDVNVTGVFLVLQHFARSLIAAGRPGAVVNTASMAKGGHPT